MKHSLCIFLVAILLLAAQGCDQPVGTSTFSVESRQIGNVAVVDLDRIAKALGRDEVMRARMAEHAEQMKKQLEDLQQNLTTRIQSEQKKLGEDATDEDKIKVNALARDADQRLKQALSVAQQANARIRVDLISKFRDEIQPVARRAASKHGMTVIMVRQENLLYFDPGTDITDAVIDELQASATAGTFAPQPSTDSTATTTGSE